jgi:hypothetical protein
MSDHRFISIDRQIGKVVLTRIEFLLRITDDHYLSNVVIRCYVHRRFMITVLDADRSSILYQKLTNFALSGLRCEVEWGSIIDIKCVQISTVVDQSNQDLVLVRLLVEDRVVERGAARVIFHMD